MTFRRILTLAVFAIAAPVASQAQSVCTPPATLQPVPGTPYYQCVDPATPAPEIGASSSIAGIAVLMGGVLMLRGRKRKISITADATA